MRKLLFLLISLLSLQSLPAQVTWSEPTITPLEKSEYKIELSATIAEGWHMYALDASEEMVNPTVFSFAKHSDYTLIGEVATTEKPLVELVRTELFNYEVSYYKDSVTFQQIVKLKGNSGAKIDFNVEWMLCNDISCIPPTNQEFSITIGTPTQKSNSLWLIIIEAMLWGFAALLTPCVFPMVPMTISFFLKGKEGEQRGRLSALIYGLFIILLYTLPIAAIILITRVLGGDAVTASIFNWVATHWLPNILFFIIFIIFAASFFGLFEITLPSKWVNESDQRGEKSSLAGIFFLALTLVLVSFSCTGPIVGSVLIKSAAGEFWQPIITMLFFSTAFAMPFVAVALSPTLMTKLPKSGEWLGSVKVVLGFLELALALKFLSVADQIYRWGILDRWLYISLWIVIFSLLGLYLIGVLKVGKRAKNIGTLRKIFAMATFAFVAYLATGLWGAPLKPLAGYLPPIESKNLAISNDLNEAQEYANKVGKPILLDFTGYGCVNCREMEQRVWSDPRVEEILKSQYIVVALYMDDKEQLPESEWVTTRSGRVLKRRGEVISHLAQERYGVNSQPTYIPLDRQGNPLIPARGYNLNIDEYIDFLNKGVEMYHNIGDK